MDRAVVHLMDAGRQMDDGVDAAERLGPVGVRPHSPVTTVSGTGVMPGRRTDARI